MCQVLGFLAVAALFVREPTCFCLRFLATAQRTPLGLGSRFEFCPADFVFLGFHQIHGLPRIDALLVVTRFRTVA